MSRSASIVIDTINDLKALRFYCFGSPTRTEAEWRALYDQLYAHMNPQFGEGFVSKRIAEGAASNVEMKSGVSKEQATLDVASTLKGINAPGVQAFVQVLQFALPENPSAQTDVWLVSFAACATSVLRETQVVFTQESIGTRSGGFGTDDQPSPRVRAVVEEIVRDQSRTPEILARLQREDPSLVRELMEWIQSQ